MHQKLHAQGSGARDDCSPDGEGLVEASLVEELRAGCLFESPQQRRGCPEILGYGAHDSLALEKREIVDSDFDERRCASRGLGCVTAASAVRPNVVEDDSDSPEGTRLRVDREAA